MVFYRKYRPQKINELDSKTVREKILDVLSLPEVPHAFLFTGPKGLGKTSTARILAKAVNCLKSITSTTSITGKKRHDAKELTRGTRDTRATRDTFQIEPCNSCDQCVSITKGTNLDILEIDAASNRGIDEIRDLRDKIKLSPIAAQKKVYIIDEVHMLTSEAFNALLKTVEEPPSHALFILCTTELHKVPATIISRCFHIAFPPATAADIARSFKRIADGEGLTIEDAAVQEIAELADGGFRDASKILEELVAMGEKVINSEVVEKRYKVASSKSHVFRLIECLQKKETKEALVIIQNLIEQGIEIKQFVLQLTDTVHVFLLEKAGISQDSRIKIQDSRLSVQELRELLILLSKVITEMKYAVLPQLPLELAIIEWASISQQKAEHIEQRVEEVVINKTTTTVIPGDKGITVATMRKQTGELARVKALYGEQKQEAKEEINKPIIKDISLLATSNIEITKEWLEHFWHVYINEIKQYNHTIAGVLRSCQIAKFDKNILIIETAYKFHKDKLSEGKILAVLEQVSKTLTGNQVKVEVVLKG